LKEKVGDIRKDLVKEKIKGGDHTKVLPKPGQWSRFALMTKKDNVKVRRAQQKMNQERLARLKFSLM